MTTTMPILPTLSPAAIAAAPEIVEFLRAIAGQPRQRKTFATALATAASTLEMHLPPVPDVDDEDQADEVAEPVHEVHAVRVRSGLPTTLSLRWASWLMDHTHELSLSEQSLLRLNDRVTYALIVDAFVGDTLAALDETVARQHKGASFDAREAVFHHVPIDFNGVNAVYGAFDAVAARAAAVVRRVLYV